MLFNSYPFIFLFLPVTVFGFFIASTLWGRKPAILWLISASLFFYGWWNPRYLALLGVVMVFNFVVGRMLSDRPDKRLLAFGIATDLAVLAYYKYANFFIANIDMIAGRNWSIEPVILPLAISFFTFQKIAYLVDSYKGLTKGYSFTEYTLFVAFFPQLIAGPIVHYKEILPQFRLPRTFRPNSGDLAVGISIFSIGLFKKTVIADNIATLATPVFTAADIGGSPSLAVAWSAALAYTLQLYFDFSGYSDMAIGAARLFGIRLPENFNSPYKSFNISEFWRRWHMTLSRFLRDYLYIPLGGNRCGEARRITNLMITMLLGGLWHGAGWTFVLWGMLHGIYLVINHLWQRFTSARIPQVYLYKALAWSLTFIAVVVAWIPFRAETLSGATRILQGMAGMNGAGQPVSILSWIWISAALFVACVLPNTQQLIGRFEPVLDFDPSRASSLPAWQPSFTWAMVIGCGFLFGVLSLNRVSEFLYFQF